MMLSCRDLDVLRLLRWCRMIRSKELCETFSKDEVVNLCAAQMIRFSDAAKACYLTPCGNRVLGSSGFALPPAKAPTYREPDITRRLRLAQIVTTAYAASVNIFLTKESELRSQPSLFLPFLHRNRGSNPWGSTRVAALLHTGDLMCAIHWVSPGIGCVALTDELTAFQNHTAAIPATQRAMIFAASSYEAVSYTHLEVYKRQGMYLKDVMNRQGEDFYYMHTLIEVTASDPETLEHRVTAVEKLCVSVDMIARRCEYKQEQAFLSMLPILYLDPDIERKSRRNALTRDVYKRQ